MGGDKHSKKQESAGRAGGEKPNLVGSKKYRSKGRRMSFYRKAVIYSENSNMRVGKYEQLGKRNQFSLSANRKFSKSNKRVGLCEWFTLG